MVPPYLFAVTQQTSQTRYERTVPVTYFHRKSYPFAGPQASSIVHSTGAVSGFHLALPARCWMIYYS